MAKTNLMTKLDRIFSWYIRLRDTNSNGWGKCVSCGKDTYITHANNCHYIPRGCKKFRFAEDNCFLGCVSCNKYRAGFHYAKYTLVMNKRLGEKEVKERWAFREAQIPFKIRTHEYEEMIDHYTAECLALLLTKSENVKQLLGSKSPRPRKSKRASIYESKG